MAQTAPFLLLSCLLSLPLVQSGTVINAAIAIYAATPAGVTAALSAAASLRENKGDREEAVVLVAMQSRVGGMTAGGLGHMDCALGAREVGGLVRDFLANCASVYNRKRRE